MTRCVNVTDVHSDFFMEIGKGCHITVQDIVRQSRG